MLQKKMHISWLENLSQNKKYYTKSHEVERKETQKTL
jgi:hypothetical protein